MDLEIVVQEAFSAEGVLSRAVDHFVPRSGQAEMAVAVAHAIENAEVLVVEASTGVGKTFSYLVPALLSGERVLVSTATKALQDMGMTNVAHIDGGYAEWIKRGAPTETLEEQKARRRPKA